MKLTLTVSGKILASVAIDPSNENNDYYLKAYRRLLVLRYEKQLRASKNKPLFSLHKPTAKAV